MDPISLIVGGATLLGGFMSSSTAKENNAANVAMQRETNQMTIAENQKNRDYQTQMSNTAYQRASADMTAAGLNPAMMFGSGNAASTPAGGVPSLQAPKNDVSAGTQGWAQMGTAVEKAVNSAVQIKTMDKMADEMSNLEAENVRIRKLAELASASTATERERAKNVQADTSNKYQDLTEKKLDRARQEWEAIKYLDLSNIPDAVRKTGNIGSWGGQKLSDVLAPVASSANAVRRLLPQVTKMERSVSRADAHSFDEFWSKRTGFGR